MMKKHSNGSAKVRFLVILVAALAAGAGLWFGARMSMPSGENPTSAGGSVQVMQNALLFPAPRELPQFTLDTANDAKLDATALKDHWTLVFIGFTHCPDICPTTLATLGGLQKVLPDLQPPMQILFVSVDPERDSADKAVEYAHYFVPDALAATADHARLEAFTRNLGMIYMQTPLPDNDYTVDHSASVAILDPQGRWVGVFRPPLDITRMAADLRQLAGGS